MHLYRIKPAVATGAYYSTHTLKNSDLQAGPSVLVPGVTSN